MSIGWLSAVVFPLLTCFFGFGMLALLERDRRSALVAGASLVMMVVLVAATIVIGPPEIRAAIVWF